MSDSSMKLEHEETEAAEAVHHVLPLVLEFLPWAEVGGVAACISSTWSAAASEPNLWAVKHAQHFGWASRQFQASGVALCSAVAFSGLLRVQREALRGDCIDVLGQWTGGDIYQAGSVFRFRLTVRAEPAGQALWRGSPDDEPFHDDRRTLPEDGVDRMVELPAQHRCIQNIREIVTGSPPCAASVCRQRHIVREGDERSVAGHIQWFVGESTDASSLERMQAIARSSYGLPGVLGRRALEFVSGMYLTTSRRLVLAGTHMNHTGFGVIALDLYDLNLSEDGLSLEGVTRGHHVPAPGQWMNRLDATAVVVPSVGVDGADAQVLSDLRAHDPQTQ